MCDFPVCKTGESPAFRVFGLEVHTRIYGDVDQVELYASSHSSTL